MKVICAITSAMICIALAIPSMLSEPHGLFIIDIASVSVAVLMVKSYAIRRTEIAGYSLILFLAEHIALPLVVVFGLFGPQGIQARPISAAIALIVSLDATRCMRQLGTRNIRLPSVDRSQLWIPDLILLLALAWGIRGLWR